VHREQRIPALDGWRGIAILLVLIAHFYPSEYPIEVQAFLNRLGQHGVTIFFVLSGFLITSRMVREYEETRRISLSRFYVRRFFRLMPCAWLYLLCMGAMHILQPHEALSCILFFRNFVDFGGHKATQHFWSLSIEEQFYLTWPFVLILAGRRRALGIAVLGACSAALWRFSIAHSHAITFMQSVATPMRVDALLIGCAAALIPARRRLPGQLFLLSAGIVAICCCTFETVAPFGESVLQGFLIWSTVNGAPAAAISLLESRLLTAVGVLSYSLYVWQQFVAQFHSFSVAIISIEVLVVFALAFLSYRYVEKPLRLLGKRLAGAANNGNACVPRKA